MMVEWLAIDGAERNLQFATKQPQEVYMQWCLWLIFGSSWCVLILPLFSLKWWSSLGHFYVTHTWRARC